MTGGLPGEIGSKRGFWWLNVVVATGAIALVGAYVMWFPTPSPTANGHSVWDFAFASFFVISMWYLCLVALTERIIITTERIIIHSLFRRFECDWCEIKRISVPPLYGFSFLFGYNLLLEAPDRKGGYFQRRVLVAASTYANRDELIKAVLEAAYSKNINVEIVGSILSAYGHPPYGVFGPTKEHTGG